MTALFEGPESLAVSIAAGSGYTVGTPSTASVTIVDDDGPPLDRSSGGAGQTAA